MSEQGHHHPAFFRLLSIHRHHYPAEMGFELGASKEPEEGRFSLQILIEQIYNRQKLAS
jgi:hypothetical protein